MSEYKLNDSPPEAEEDYTREPRHRGGKYLPLLTGVAVVMAVSSLVTAGAAVTMAVHSQDHSDEHIAELVSAIGSGGGRHGNDGRATAQSDDPGVRHDNKKNNDKKNDDGKDHTIPKGGHSSGGSASSGGGSGSASGGSASSGGGSGSASGGSASSGGGSRSGGKPGQVAPVDDSTGAGDSANAGAQVDESQVDEEQFANAIPAATADILLSNAMSASDASLTSPQRYYWAVDGAKAGPTLDQVADIRARAAVPPGMEELGVGSISFEVHNVVVNGDTATATLVLVFPGEWGKWEYPDSGFQYVDGEWKLQKSAVCNLAKAAWIDCY